MTARMTDADVVARAVGGESVGQISLSGGRSRRSVQRALQRAGLRAARPQAVHGTLQRYRAYGCRCEPCLAAHRAQISAYVRGAGKPLVQARHRAYRLSNPHRERAWRAVETAVANGTLIRPDRCRCGRTARLVAHHDDYSRPLDVLWLCGVCHRARHQMLESEAAA